MMLAAMIRLFAVALAMQLFLGLPGGSLGGIYVGAAGAEIARLDNRTGAATRAAPQTPPFKGPRCRTSAGSELEIACDYSAAPHSDRAHHSEPGIVLTRMLLTFKPAEESHMRVELTFRNSGTKPILEARSAYLVIDGDTGQNYFRRLLPHADFRQLKPGISVTFSDLLFVGALRPGRYVVRLWIPNPERALKFDPAASWLLSSEGVADSATGLNTIATFSVTRETAAQIVHYFSC